MMSRYQLEREIRQLEKMITVIDAYSNKRLSLQNLASSLSFLIGVLEIVPEAWQEEVRNIWGNLEFINADQIVTGRKLNSKDFEFIQSIYLELDAKIKDMKQKLEDQLL